MTALAQRAFSGGVLSPSMYGRIDIPKWQTGLKKGVNVLLRAEGGVYNRAGTKLAGGYDTSTVDGNQYLIPFEFSVDDTYQLEFGDEVMRVMKDGVYVLNSSISGQTVSAVTTADPARLEMTNSTAAAEFTVGRLVYLSDPNGDCALHQAILEVTAISSEFITFKIVGGVTVDNAGDDWGTIGSGAQLFEVYEVTSPFAIEDIPELYHVQDVDTLIFAGSSYQPHKLVRTADDEWTFTQLTFQPEISAPTGESATDTEGTGSTTYTYVVAAVDDNTGEESLPSSEASCTNDLTTAGNYNTITWNAVSGASNYIVYKEFNGVFGYIGITPDLTFDDENITPDTADNPQDGRDPFSGVGNDPSVCAFIENRLAFANTANNPQAVEMSTSVSPFNFNRALTPGASDALSFRMRSQQLNRVQHIVELDYPVILTSGAEWVMRTQNEEPVSATVNFSLKPQTYRGSSSVKPVIIGSTLMHVLRDNVTIREFSLQDRRDQTSADVTLLARHLFRGKEITSMGYAQAPDSILWVVFADGSVVTMTYLEEHEIWGWTTHELGGTDTKVKQVSVVREGSYDIPYFVVERTLDGGTVSLVERLDTREMTDVTDAYFVDAGLRYNGAAATSLRGYLHLRGENVAALADGSVVDGVVVSGQGTVTLDAASEKVAVGYSITSKITSLPSDFGDSLENTGSALGDYRAPSEVALQVADTRGVAVGQEGGFMNEVKQFTGEEPIPLETATLVVPVEGDWGRDVSIEVQQKYPLPFEITAWAPEWSIGG